MTEGEAFVVALLLMIGATVVTRKYLSSDSRMALGVIAALTHLA